MFAIEWRLGNAHQSHGLLSISRYQQPPAALSQRSRRGRRHQSFRAENLYSFGSLDSVAVMQGGLSIQIPIASFGSEIRTSLQLVYQSSAWEALPQTCPPLNNCAQLYPKKQSRAGLGWRVSLGDLYQPSPGGAHTPQRFVWASSDGAEHALYPTLHPDDPQDSGDPIPSIHPFEKVMYTRDGSYARVKCDTAPPETGGYGDCTVETAAGEKHYFNNTSGGTSASYRLESITDRFSNEISIQYLANPTRWRIFDDHTTPNSGRDIVLTFFTPASNAGDQPLLLQSIDLPCFVANGEATCRGENGTRTSWEFGYVLKNTFPPSVFGQSPVSRPVWFLDQVDLPDGSIFSFPDYSTTTVGGLMTMELPTVGSIEWTWDVSSFPAVRDEPSCPVELPPYADYWTTVYGVSQRREYGLDHTLRGVTTYRRFPDVAEPGIGEIWTVLVESPFRRSLRAVLLRMEFKFLQRTGAWLASLGVRPSLQQGGAGSAGECSAAFPLGEPLRLRRGHPEPSTRRLHAVTSDLPGLGDR